MTISQIKPSKVKTVRILVSDYHLSVGQEVKVYWNKQAKRFITINQEHDQNGNIVCGGWSIDKENFEVV